MNITHESTGELTATLKVEVSESDYIESVNKKLKEYQRKSNMPGFRPGKVPFGMIKKLYGHATMLDEVNNIVSKEITSYIHKKELKIIGYPLPDYEKGGHIDFGSQPDFELFYEMGFRPDFELRFSDEIILDYFKIKCSEDDLENEIIQLKQTYGQFINPELSEQGDWIDGNFEQLGENGQPLGDGISVKNYINPSSLHTEDQKARFTGLKKGDQVIFNIREVFPDNKDIAHLLKVKASKAHEIAGMFSFTVSQISRMIPAEVNEDLFNRVFPETEDMNETKFRNLLRSSVEYRREPESDRKFFEDAKEKLFELHSFSLPEDFLKKLMLERSEEKITAEDIEKDFPDLIRNLKWDIIRERIFEKFDIKVTEDEKRNLVMRYFEQHAGMDLAVHDNRIKDSIDKILSNEEESEKIENQLLSSKLLTIMKNTFTLRTKEVTLGEFFDLIGNVSPSNHHHVHNEHCNHDDEEHSHDENV